MIKKIFIGIGVAVLLFVLFVVYSIFIATPASPPATVKHSAQGLEISVDYSRPYKKGRLIFGNESEGALQPYGKYWRLGANAATEVTFSKDVLFGGKPLQAGSYRLYAIPGADSFEVRVNSELDVFFAVSEADPELDLFSVTVPVVPQDKVTEMFTISFSNSDSDIMMDFVWDKIKFSIPISVQ
ncbi:DUF2911 domain-containing protein [Reichenbachiella sp. MALMAid0571]|uniref:DUF2911 domain-containing protein n=1 Tax=Reichenbachiella sp. MALMAid0571 TaxID=3143939 RepID=UPI0032E0032E